MAIWCLTKSAEANLLAELRKDGDPQKMVDRGSEGRLAWFTKQVGAENAKNLNALFESKMLLKNQITGFKSFIKYMGGSRRVKRNFIAKVESLNKALNKTEVDQYLNDYITKRLGLEVTQEEFERITVLTDQVNKAKVTANIEELSKLTPRQGLEWMQDASKNDKRLDYGRKVVAVDNYVTKLKLEAGELTAEDFFKAPIATTMRGIDATLKASKATRASMDNSALLNQGFPILANYKTAGAWAKNALASFKAMADTFGGKAVMDEVRADVVSRPSYLNGLYKDQGLAINVLEEEFPTSLPAKLDLKVKLAGKKRTIVPLGTLYKATEVAFNSFQLKNRVDAFDIFVGMAENSGKDITRGSQDIIGLGKFVNALTGRGRLGKLEPVANIINAPFFSLRRQASIVESLFGYQLGKQSKFTRQQGAMASSQQILFIATVLGIAGALGAEIEKDPNSANFGKIKIGDTRFDVSQGRSSYVTLASRLLTKKFKSSTTGKVTQLNTGKFGGKTTTDLLVDFIQNKFSPALGAFIAILNGKERFTGKDPTVTGTIKNLYVPLSFESYKETSDNPNSANLMAVALGDFFGMNSNTYSKYEQQIPESLEIEEDSFISAMTIYAKAMNVDPVTAFNRILTGQKIVRVTGNTIVVGRMPLEKSQTIKKKRGGDTSDLKLDHTIPLQLGGSNSKSNLKLVPTAEHSKYTRVENHLGKALKAGKVSKREAVQLITDYKAGKIESKTILNRFKRGL